jgi:hypothetical protein
MAHNQKEGDRGGKGSETTPHNEAYLMESETVIP